MLHPLLGALSSWSEVPGKKRHRLFSPAETFLAKKFLLDLAKKQPKAYIYFASQPTGSNSSFFSWGCTGFDVEVEARVAGRGAAGLVKSGNNVIANKNDYAYAYAA